MRTTPPRFSNNGFAKERMDEIAFDRRLSRSSRPRASRKGAAAKREFAVSPSKPAERAERRAASAAGLQPWRRGRNPSQGGSPAHAMGAKADSARCLGGAVAGGRRGGQARRYSGVLAEAYARGRDEGRAEGRADAADRHAAELAAARREAETDRLEFQRNEYAELEGAIRSGLKEIEDNVGAAVTRILTPFLDKQVVKRAADELCKAIARLGAAGSPGLMTIRGPERVLALLRPRIADLPVKIASVDDKSAEVVVEAGATQVVTALRSWAKLLASLAD